MRLIYRHGLRASEAKDARWTDFDIMAGSGPKTFHVRRLKGSVDSVHTLDRGEVSALRKLKATGTSPFVFVSERGGPLSPDMDMEPELRGLAGPLDDAGDHVGRQWATPL